MIFSNTFLKRNLSRDFINLSLIFLVWRIILLFVQFLALNFVPLGNTDKFLGGGPFLYTIFPEVFAWANFDGEHYLSIAIFGYKDLEQAFFPVYPKIIGYSYNFLQPVLPTVLPTPPGQQLFYSTVLGLLLSNLATFLAIIFLWKLVVVDFSPKVAYLSVICLLVFPTSFFLVSLYNEALFLLLLLISFYLIRKNPFRNGGKNSNWFTASLVGLISSATRIFGILLLPSFLIEAWQQKLNWKVFFWVLFIPGGLFLYMFYQWIQTGDPLAFYHLQKIVGEQHQSGLTLLPQVYFRYTKMALTVSRSDPLYISLLLEFAVGVMFFILPIYGYFKKIRLSYLFYALVGFLLPTIQGSFSSVPRSILAFFPSFIALALFLDNKSLLFKMIYLSVSTILLLVFCIMYLRGYWVA
jgi:hypothetical protein